jgi:hypothetical protein
MKVGAAYISDAMSVLIALLWVSLNDYNVRTTEPMMCMDISATCWLMPFRHYDIRTWMKITRTQGQSDIDICKIWGFHGGDYEEWCLLGCYAVWLL